MNATQLQQDEYTTYFKNYIEQAGTVELIEGLSSNMENMLSFYKGISSDKIEYRYAEGKWTIKEIINHLIDTERVFCYRALRFSRQDSTVLNGFDENEFATASLANTRTLTSLLEEYKLTRLSTITLFNSFNDDMLKYKGSVGEAQVSVRALGFLTIGHEIHHSNIIKSRYLVSGWKQTGIIF